MTRNDVWLISLIKARWLQDSEEGARGTVSQIRGSGPINKDETLMMMGILMLMLMLRVMRG